ncbi:MAG TPA: GNAT family N-acetyltransferase [bacterium]|nr:GNAT family N-acetyltransferase [bacterium]
MSIAIGRDLALPSGQIVRLRGFRDGDHARLAEIRRLAFPGGPWSEAEVRDGHGAWDNNRYAFFRVVAEGADGRMVGFGRISHEPWEFHARGYGMNLMVEPAHRRRGVGTAIYEALIAELRRWDAAAVRACVVTETMSESIAFLWHRGFVEMEQSIARTTLVARPPRLIRFVKAPV